MMIEQLVHLLLYQKCTGGVGFPRKYHKWSIERHIHSAVVGQPVDIIMTRISYLLSKIGLSMHQGVSAMDY